MNLGLFIKHWKPTVSLLLLSPFLTELLSSNTPASVFFRPVTFLFSSTVIYGFPVLFLREIAARRNFGLLGLFFLGVMYGLYNEALVAKTVFFPFHSPIDSFAAYGLVGSVRMPWLMTISFWHSLYAVIFPIVFVNYLFPDSANGPWIGNRTAWLLGIVSLVFGVLAFFNGPRLGEVSDRLFYFALIAGSFIVLWLMANRFSFVSTIVLFSEPQFSWKAFYSGAMLCAAFFIVPLVLSELGLQPFIFLIYFALITLFALIKLYKFREIPFEQILLVAIGGEMMFALFIIFATAVSGRTESVLAGFVFLVIFLAVLITIKKAGIQK